MVNLYIVRHGFSESNYYSEKGDKKTARNIKDPLLHKKGIRQADKLKNIDWKNRINIAWSSPLRRTIRTGTLALQNTNIKIKIKRTLREMHWQDKENTGLQLGWKHLVPVAKINNRTIDDIIHKDKIENSHKFWDPNNKPNKRDEKCEMRAFNILWESLINKLYKLKDQKGLAVFTHYWVVEQLMLKLERHNNFNFLDKYNNKNCCVWKINFNFNSKNDYSFNFDLVNHENRCLK